MLAKVLVMMAMKGMAAGQGAQPATVVLAVESQLQVLAEGHVPAVERHRLDWGNLQGGILDKHYQEQGHG